MTQQGIRISFYCDEKIEADLKRWAKKEQRTVSNLLRKILSQERERRGEKNDNEK